MDIITGKILKLHNWPDGKIIGIAKNIAAQLSAQGLGTRRDSLRQLDAVRQNPGPFPRRSSLNGRPRARVHPLTQMDEPSADELLESPMPYPHLGAGKYRRCAVAQMDNAMRLPVTVAGALMPDAHVGYGLPIGGVLATENAVIPYAVGVDIACRMRLSLYEVSPYLAWTKARHVRRCAVE